MSIQIHYHKCTVDSVDKSKVNPLFTVLDKENWKFSKGCSKKIRGIILDALMTLGWSSKVKLSVRSQISVTAMNGSCALCLQTGNMSRFYADLLKMQYLYEKGVITQAVYIIPTKKNAKIMGSNVAFYERLVQELSLFSGFITVPIAIFGLN